MQQVRKAVIPVAGYGTRFLPFTKAVPKAMLPIINMPAVQRVIQEAVDGGIEEIILIIGQHKEIIEEHFSKSEELEKVLLAKGDSAKEYLESVVYPSKMAKIRYIVQNEQLGTGHAVMLAEEFIKDEPFAVMFGDDVMKSKVPVIKQLIDVFEREEKTVIGVKKVGFDNVSKYASVEYDDCKNNVYSVTKITEKPKKEEAKSDLAPLGRYVVDKDFFKLLHSLKPGKNGEYQFTDALDMNITSGGVLALEFEGNRYDMGDTFGFLQANVEFALDDPLLKDKMKNYLSEISKNL